MTKRLPALLVSPVLALGLVTAPAVAEGADSDAATQLQPQDPPVAGTSSISWFPCRQISLQRYGAECAKVPVPLDYSKPGGKKIKLAVSRVLHRGGSGNYQGVMLVNPGGPGGSGLAMSTIGGYFPDSISSAYDWIGFDPRGVGTSRPAITCDKKYFGFNRPNYYPKPKKNRDAWLQRSRKYAAKCKKKNGALLKHMTTVDNVRDMESLRVALGADKINYYGFSYGTYLGQIYSTLYPQRVRRQVLDSNVNPRRVFYQANLDQDIAFQKVFDLWFDWIAKYNSTYRLGTTGEQVARRFTEIQDQLAAKPAGGKIGPDEWIDMYQSAAYSTYSWTDLASLFSRFSRTGDAQPLIREYRTSSDYGDDNSFAVYNAVQCTDAPWPRKWSTWSQDNWETYKKAPLMTWPNAWFNAPCLYWPAPARDRFRVKGKKAPGTLLISGTLDAATPYQGSKKVRSLFPKSRLVAIKGEASHATSLDGNPCVDNVLYNYLSTGKLPRRRAGNKADVTCRALPLPQPQLRQQSGFGRPEALHFR